MDFGDLKELFVEDDRNGYDVNKTRCATTDVTMILMIFIEREQREFA